MAIDSGYSQYGFFIPPVSGVITSQYSSFYFWNVQITNKFFLTISLSIVHNFSLLIGPF